MLDWDNARIFLAVARTGQMLGAARKLGLDAYGVSFHVGSQQTRLDAWDVAVGEAGVVVRWGQVGAGHRRTGRRGGANGWV